MKNSILKKGFNVVKYLYAIVMVYALSISTVLAEGEESEEANSAWDAVINFIKDWIPKLGGVVVFIGAIEFALAFKSEDPEGKTKGVRTIVAGVMVIAIPTVLASVLQ